MKGKLFLIHWNAEEVESLAQPLRDDGWQVATEAQDAARAARQIISAVPAAAVIFLSKLPLHGVSTAYYLRSVRQTRRLPIVFVDVPSTAVERAKRRVPDALFASKAELGKVLTPSITAVFGGIAYGLQWRSRCAAATAAIAQAIKASGAIVQVEPKDFLAILAKSSKPLVVTAKGGVFKPEYQYLSAYKGLIFFTKAPEPLRIMQEIELVQSRKIWIPG